MTSHILLAAVLAATLPTRTSTSAPAATQPATTRPATTQPAATQPASARPTTMLRARDLELQRVYLDNGIQGLLLRDPEAPMVGVFALVRAGGVHERAGEDGLSHFLEHLLFNGTEMMDQDELYTTVDLLGGYSNATTRVDHTLFQMLVPREALETALGLHADMLFRSTLPPAKLEKERGIVLEEIAKDEASASAGVEREATRHLWAGTPRARPVIGTPDTLRSIGRDAVMAYWRRRYVPANVTVLVVGDADLPSFREALGRTYGQVSVPPCAPPLDPPVPLPVGDGGSTLETVAADGDRLELRVAFPGPAPGHPDAAVLEVLATLLAEGPGVALDASLRLEGITASAGANLERVAGATTFLVNVSAEPGVDPAHLLASVRRAIETAAARLADDDLEAVHTRLAVGAAFLAEKPHYFGLEKAPLLANGGASAVESEPVTLQRVDRAALLDATDRWLSSRPSRALAVGPGLPSTAGTATPSGVPSPSRAPAVATRRATGTLDNGLRYSVASNPASHVFAAHVLVKDRSAREPLARPGLADLVHRLLEPVGSDLSSRLARIGASLKTTDSPWIPYDDYYDVPEYGFIRLETADAFAHPAVAALAELLVPNRATAGAIATAVAAEAAAAAPSESSAGGRSRLLLAAALHGAASPFARPVHGGAAALADVTSDELYEFARTYLDPSQLIVTVETGLDLETATALLSEALGGLRGSGASTPAAAPPGGSVEPSPREEELGGPQSYVRYGAALDIDDRDRAAVYLAAAVYSDRLQEDIREERGMAYSIGAGLTLRPAPWGDEWTAAAGTRPENLDTVRAAMISILTELRAEGPTPEELRKVAGRARGRALMRRLSGIGRAYATGLELWQGEEPGASLARLRALEAVGVDEVRAALVRYFDPAMAVVVTVR